MTPRANGEIVTKGRVGRDLDVATAQDAAALSARNALVAIELALGGLERIEAALQLVVYVQTSDGFTDHSRVADGASRVLLDVLGDRGRAARSAVGVLSLPGGACMELWLTVAYQATVGSAR
jgi:enamine deaminase RidA (YjgF/YER057c/UK114 family)